MSGPIKDGEYTATIYGMIKDNRYLDAIRVLNFQLEISPNSRAALSLVGYCSYYMQDYVSAVECYEQLTQLYPYNDDYKLYYAQSLYMASMYAEATSVVNQIENPKYQAQVIKLQAAIKYNEDEIQNAKSLVEQTEEENDPDAGVNLACLEYKEGDYNSAIRRMQSVINAHGYKPYLGYAMALCFYKQQQYSSALRYLADIIDKGIKDNPELGIGSGTDGDGTTVPNTMALHDTALIQAFNLKAAIEFNLKNRWHKEAALDSLSDMPTRAEEELDPVTLHNQALMNMETSPADGFAKLQFLLAQNPCPPETFANLLLLYCKFEYYDLAADVLAENAHLTYKHLSQYMYDYLDAVITQQTSPDDAYAKFDALANQQMDLLRKSAKKVQESRQIHNDEMVKQASNQFEQALMRYLPVVMGQARIYWDMNEYSQVEKIFRKSVEFCSEHDVWRLNVAHTLFMQQVKFKEAAAFYEPIVKKNYEKILDVSAIVLANLCVCYIMTNQNEAAEELMRKVEKEEETISYEFPDRKVYHLCIINLVIGTLYCSKGNYEFGISRVIKAMEPFPKKIGTDTWFYAKRCFLSLIENLVKHMIVVRDSVLHECIVFLQQCELFGKSIPTVIDGPLQETQLNAGKNSVTYESRLMRALLLNVLYN